jgi:cysteine synthase A
VLTPGAKGMRGAIAAADELLAEQTPAPSCRSSSRTPANPEIHRRTTAEEIWNDTDGKVDIFVAGVGTGGTVTGVGEVLKAASPGVQVSPSSRPTRRCSRAASPARTRSRASAPASCPRCSNTEIYDEIIKVTADQAFESRASWRAEGILVGISAGANAWAAGRWRGGREPRAS